MKGLLFQWCDEFQVAFKPNQGYLKSCPVDLANKNTAGLSGGVFNTAAIGLTRLI